MFSLSSCCQVSIGQRDGISAVDAEQMNRLYKCGGAYTGGVGRQHQACSILVEDGHEGRSRDRKGSGGALARRRVGEHFPLEITKVLCVILPEKAKVVGEDITLGK